MKDVAIHLERHESLDVFPMMQATLKPDNLFVSTSDKDSNRHITFLVKKAPKMGRLLLRLPTSDKVSFILQYWIYRCSFSIGYMKIFNRVIDIFILLGKNHALVKIMGDRRNSIAIKNHFMYSALENNV